MTHDFMEKQLEAIFSGVDIPPSRVAAAPRLRLIEPDEWPESASAAAAPRPAPAPPTAQPTLPTPPAPSRRVPSWAIALSAVFLLGVLIGWAWGPCLWGDSPVAAAGSSLPASPAPTVPLVPSATPTATPSPSATPTPSPTATQPPPPTPTPTPTPVALITPQPLPTIALEVLAAISSTMPIPTAVPPVPLAADAVNILVLGSDRRPDWSEWHVDALHLVSIQTGRPTVTVLSIPRDLYVYIPSFWMSRINMADYYGEAHGYPGGGSALLRDTILYNLGLGVDYIARTDFDGLIGIVDTVGGIDVPVHCSLSDYWPYPDDDGVYPVLTMEPGVVHMDGETALWYARSRRTTSVFSRERRQQQVLQAIYHQARDARMLSQIPALWRQGREMVTTDLELAEMLDLGQVALQLDEQNIRFYTIGREQVTPWTTPYGGAVFLPRWEAIEPLLVEAMAPPPEARLARTFMPVEVLNGSAHTGWGALVVDRLVRAGFPALTGETEPAQRAQSQLIVYAEYAKGTGVEELQQLFALADEQVIYQPGESTTLGFQLIVGADYQTCPQP